MNSITARPGREARPLQGQRRPIVDPSADSYAGTSRTEIGLIKPDFGLLPSRGVSDSIRVQAERARAGHPESIQAFFSVSKTVDGAVAESYAGLVADWARQDGPGFVERLGQASRDCWGSSLELVRYGDPEALLRLSTGRSDGSGRPDGALADAYAGVVSEMAAQDPVGFVDRLASQGRGAWGPALAYVGYANPSALVGLAEGKPDGALAELYAGMLAERAVAEPSQFVRSLDGASRDSWRTALEMVRYANPSAFDGLAGSVDGAIAEIYEDLVPGTLWC